MNKLWRVVSGVALVCLVVGILAVGVGFFMGSSPVVIEQHGALTEYMERLAYNRDVMLRGAEELVRRLGLS